MLDHRTFLCHTYSQTIVVTILTWLPASYLHMQLSGAGFSNHQLPFVLVTTICRLNIAIARHSITIALFGPKIEACASLQASGADLGSSSSKPDLLTSA